jgi:hypothetical protein
VAQSDVFARVKEDLALGHTHLAIRRLRTYLVLQPADTSARRLLSSVYRQTGNLVEAGRWEFLCEGEVHADELAAFVRANPSPFLRLQLLNWTAPTDQLPDAAARARFAALQKEAKSAGPPARWREAPAKPTKRAIVVPCVFTAVALTAIGALVGIGLWRVLEWVLT